MRFLHRLLGLSTNLDQAANLYLIITDNKVHIRLTRLENISHLRKLKFYLVLYTVLKGIPSPYNFMGKIEKQEKFKSLK